MSKVIAASTICVLFVASGAMGTLLQDQITSIGLTNTVQLLNGDQNASGMQNLVVDNGQQSSSGACGSCASQSLFASIGESADALGSCGLVDAIQLLGIDGVQAQEVGDGVAAKAQLQALGLTAGQTLGKADGFGTASALHTIVINEGQQATNAAGTMAENATIMGMQTSNTFGQPGATNVVDSTMVVTTQQSQTAG
jgi:hypothetical protein